jgi:hypothetical protein
LAIGLILVNGESIFGLLSNSFGSTGIVTTPNIEVYRERECINEVSLLNWGVLTPNSTKTATIFVKKIGTIDLELNVSAENWAPENCIDYLNFSWNYSGITDPFSNAEPITLTLKISENIERITNFEFNILIIGTEVNQEQ